MGTNSKTGFFGVFFFLCVYKAFSPFPAKQSPFIHSSCSISWKELKSPLQQELELCRVKFCHFHVCQTFASPGGTREPQLGLEQVKKWGGDFPAKTAGAPR